MSNEEITKLREPNEDSQLVQDYMTLCGYTRERAILTVNQLKSYEENHYHE